MRNPKMKIGWKFFKSIENSVFVDKNTFPNTQ